MTRCWSAAGRGPAALDQPVGQGVGFGHRQEHPRPVPLIVVGQGQGVHGADAGLLVDANQTRLGGPFHVEQGGDAAQERLGAAQARGVVLQVGAAGAIVGHRHDDARRGDLINPFGQGQVIARTFQVVLQAVMVRVNQAGQDRFAPRRNRAARLVAAGQFAPFPHSDDALAGDGDRAVVEDTLGRVHGDDRAALDEQVNLLRLCVVLSHALFLTIFHPVASALVAVRKPDAHKALDYEDYVNTSFTNVARDAGRNLRRVLRITWRKRT